MEGNNTRSKVKFKLRCQLSVCMPFYMRARLSACPSVCASVSLRVRLSARPSVCVSVCLRVRLMSDRTTCMWMDSALSIHWDALI